MKSEEKLLISKIPVLKKLLLKSDKFTKEGIKRNIIPPTFKHLNFIYNLVKKNKRISSLEFGVGWSSLVISKALDENKKKYFYKSLFLKRIFKDNLFMNYVIDAEKKYLKIFKNFSNKIELKNIRFKKILWQYMLKKNSIVAYGKNLPGIIPDFIYLDGPNPRKIREGLVVSTSMDKTAVVAIVDRVRHRRYNKTVQRTKKLFVHDSDNDLNVGDRVRIQETRPLSKKKRWRILEILERAR